jgi:hypothetical protein
VIKPTIGRIVLFMRGPAFAPPRGMVIRDDKTEMAAIVADVHGDRMVNLSVIDHIGQPFGITSVQLLQDDDKPGSPACWCQWMEYQKQVAKGEIQPNFHVAKA